MTMIEGLSDDARDTRIEPLMVNVIFDSISGVDNAPSHEYRRRVARGGGERLGVSYGSSHSIFMLR